MTWTLKMVRELAKGSLIRLRGFVKYLKLTALLEIIGNSSLRLIRYSTRKVASVISLKS